MLNRLVVNFIGHKVDQSIYSLLLRKYLPENSSILLKVYKKHPTLAINNIFEHHPSIKTIITVQNEFISIPDIRTVNIPILRKHDKLYQDVKYDPIRELKVRELLEILKNLKS